VRGDFFEPVKPTVHLLVGGNEETGLWAMAYKGNTSNSINVTIVQLGEAGVVEIPRGFLEGSKRPAGVFCTGDSIRRQHELTQEKRHDKPTFGTSEKSRAKGIGISQ